ncbi:MAG: AGE family epimerase/isomerase [Reinekea sp.]|jgi:cellobiose epimerase
MKSLQPNPRSNHLFKVLASEMAAELNNNLIPYWLGKIDPRGGFFSHADCWNNVDETADKGALLNSRILWFFARTARQLNGQPVAQDCYAAGQHAWLFLKEKLIDRESGGLYWSVDAYGTPVDTQKHMYNQAFAIYALAEWYDTCADDEVLALALTLRTQVEQHARDRENRGYMEAFDRHWNSISNTLICDTLICDTDDGVADKSMNTHIHLLEAYSRLYDVSPDNELKSSLSELLQLLCTELQNERSSFSQFFSRKWKTMSVDHSFGHDIEGSWLIWETAQKVMTGEALEGVRATIIGMAESVHNYGLDFDGTVCSEWVDNRFVDTTRIWWVQAEAILGFCNAWQVSSMAKYLCAAIDTWQVVKRMFIDHENGDWHWETDRLGNVNHNRPKVSQWKCPYHSGRACLEIMRRAAALDAP